MTNSIFKTKEQYLTFRAVWASAVSDAKNQPRPKPQYKSHRYLNAAHHILYNVLRGRAFDRGFAPITNSNKLKNGTLINFGLYNGMYDLQNIC